MPERGRLVLFALTGLGNRVLERLASEDLAPDLLVTRTEQGPYPYEQLAFIGDLATRLKVPYKPDIAGEKDVASNGASLLLVATYHRKIDGSVLVSCGEAINLHPSLLPRNRGANPMFWSIYNGDSNTGVTAHALTEGFDDGPVCAQSVLPIFADETQTSLRRKLGEAAADLAVLIVRTSRTGSLDFRAQNSTEATTYPRVGEQQYQIDLSRTAESVCRHVNALRDWPLARLGQRRIQRVLAIAPPSAALESTSGLDEKRDTLWVHAADADLLLELDAPR
jgi:methionyl-tRNA formyltransferase